MNKVSKLFSYKKYSFSTKLILLFLVFIIVFLLIKTSLTIPMFEARALNNEIKYITRSLLIIKEQVSGMGKALKMQSDLEKELIKEKITHQITKLNHNIENLSSDDLLNFLNKNINHCTYKLIEQKDSIKNKDTLKSFNKWEKFKDIDATSRRASNNYIYNYEIKKSNKILSITCTNWDLNPNHASFEKSIKVHIRTNLLAHTFLSSAKSAFFWLHKNQNINEVLYEENDELRRKKYGVSNLSSVRNIPTGNLTIKQILEYKNKNKPILHKIKDKEVYTWIIDLSSSPINGSYFILSHTIDKEELINKEQNEVMYLLPETLISIAISFILILLLFKRLLKNINTITKTAKLVNQGKKNIRSGVRGNDDIGILGEAFDTMLNLFENSIKNLDKKVEEKTKTISKSLEEKEILLKEIHHRVKNNLALTISLIELQEEDIEDENTRKVLIDIQERIFTMELLHRKLYESTNINNISFKEYITDLSCVISRTYDMKNKVNLCINMKDINLNIETAMPCGLILNELITNAYKYAFKEQKNPKLEIEVLKENDNLTMSIKDNGKGLLSNFENCYDKTLGLKLINTIVKYQLFGDFTYEYNEGAQFIIKGKVVDTNIVIP